MGLQLAYLLFSRNNSGTGMQSADCSLALLVLHLCDSRCCVIFPVHAGLKLVIYSAVNVGVSVIRIHSIPI